jgi:hypothetical protein
MEMMDYDFHLFTESGSGQDSVVYRFGPGPFRLAQLDPRPELIAPYSFPVNLLKTPAPVLTAKEAQDRLDATDYPFLFFRDATTGRGSVLYARYDGHYGLVTATFEASAVPVVAETGTTGTTAAASGTAGTAEATGPVAAVGSDGPGAAVVGEDPGRGALGERLAALEGRVAALAEALDQLAGGLEAPPGTPVDLEELRRSASLAREMLLAAGFRR